MNVARWALIIIFLLMAIVIFFALTGMDVRNPMPTVVRILNWVVELNRTLTRLLREFLFSVRMSIQEGFR